MKSNAICTIYKRRDVQASKTSEKVGLYESIDLRRERAMQCKHIRTNGTVGLRERMERRRGGQDQRK